MPKILRIINRLNLGGPTYNVGYLTKYLAPEFETILCSGVKDDTEESSEFIISELGITPHYISTMRRELNIVDDYTAYKEISELIKKHKPDIVHTHMAKPGAVGRLAAIHNNVPVVLHTFHGHYFHSYFSPLKTKLFKSIEQYLARKSAGIVTISKLQQQELSVQFKIAPPEKTFLVPLGFDLSRFSENMTEKRKSFRTKYGIADDEIAIGIIGRLVPIKNHKLFLRAISEVLKKTNKKVRAVIIGDGENKKEVIDLCFRYKLAFGTDNFETENHPVIFTSWFLNIDEALAGLDIVALTSLNEGTPVSLIEAQAASKPIVSTDVGGVRDVVLENVTALLSPSENAEILTKNILALVEDENLRTKFSQAGPAHVNKNFHYTSLVENMRSLYHSLLNK